MSPRIKDRKPSPYKEKGAVKEKAIKFVVTPDEYQALEILAKDWGISMAQAVRTMIGVSQLLSEMQGIIVSKQGKELMIKHGINPSEIDWRLTTLKRFNKYWNGGGMNLLKNNLES